MPLPESVNARLTYLTHVLGHPCYERWTQSRIKQGWRSLGEAKAAKPQLLDLRLKHPVAIECWESGRLRTAVEGSAPDEKEVQDRLLHSYRRWFRVQEVTGEISSDTSQLDTWLSVVEPRHTAILSAWLMRSGRFINSDPATNTLAVLDDAQAISLFLHDRASRSRIWKTASGGWFVVDEVVGKHEIITYAVGIRPKGKVAQIVVLDYHESYGYEVSNEQWRRQFIGKLAASPIKLEKDIENISGATLSCKHITDGVRRVISFYDMVLKNSR